MYSEVKLSENFTPFCDFAGEKAVEATNYAINLAANPNFKIDADGSALAGLRDGSVKAMFTGSWDANAIKEALGDNMGVSSLPTYTINGQEKQMLSYAGSKAIGVNAHSEYMEQAVALAVYLGGSDILFLELCVCSYIILHTLKLFHLAL